MGRYYLSPYGKGKIIELYEPFPSSMTKLEAARECVEKWEFIAANVTEDAPIEADTYGCAFCHLYRTSGNWCKGCPIREKVQAPFCACTPFADYSEDQSKENAQREVEFLKEILRDLEAEQQTKEES